MSITFQAELKNIPFVEKKVYLSEKYGIEESYFENDRSKNSDQI